VTALVTAHEPVSGLAGPVNRLLKVHNLALVSHALPKVRTIVVEVNDATVVVVETPDVVVHATVGVAEVEKKPVG